jgi:hypothetical protein
MAMMEPDGAFTEDVLRLTAGLRQGSGTVSRARELRCWWVRLLARPRFAWEAAYLGALILLLAIGNPRLILDQFQARVPVPVRLVQTGESLIQGATGAFDEKQIAAERFFGNLRLQGRQLLDQAGVIRGRAAAAVLQGTSWLADTVRAAWPGETAAPK